MKTIELFIVVVNKNGENIVDRPFYNYEEAQRRVERLETRNYSAWIEKRYMNI